MNALARLELPDWPRLMSEDLAAAYLSIGTTKLREEGPAPKRHGRRVLYDRRDLDRWADALNEQPLSEADQVREAQEVERRWREKRAKGANSGR
jgi:hypothetical protein